jgi:hypothetical protein
MWKSGDVGDEGNQLVKLLRIALKKHPHPLWVVVSWYYIF